MRFFGWMGLFILNQLLGGGAYCATGAQPSIASLLKPAILQKVTRDRLIQSHASLDALEASAASKRYSFYSTMLVHAKLKRAREVLTRYELYSQLIPYINEAVFYPRTQLLDLKGGIWRFELASRIHFVEIAPTWIHFQVVRGHFAGLQGDLFFEPYLEDHTLIYLRGTQEGEHWPPRFIIERGAEIVFEFTARRMRSYIESTQSAAKGANTHDPVQNSEPRTRHSVSLSRQ